MQTETKAKSQQTDTVANEELIDVLIAISVVAKRLAENLRKKEPIENGGQADEQDE